MDGETPAHAQYAAPSGAAQFPTPQSGTIQYDAAQYEDGNALAGPLREIFAVDVTAATGRCVGCGNAGPLAALRLYTHAPGLVARCPQCDQVVLSVVRAPDAVWLDLRGTLALKIPVPAE